MNVNPGPDDCWRAFRGHPSEETFAPVYERTRRLVYTICYRILRNPEDAADAFQSAYCRLLAKAKDPKIALESTDFNRFVGRLAAREARNLRDRRRRRRKREVAMEPTPEPADSNPPPDRIAATAETRDKIEALASLLPDKFRVPLLLHYFDGMTQVEIASALELPEGTVRSRIARGMKRLRFLVHRAGLGEATLIAGVLISAAHLLEPPAALGPGIVYAQADALLASGGIAAATGASVSAGVGTATGAKSLMSGGGVKALVAALGLSLGIVVVSNVLDLSGRGSKTQPANSALTIDGQPENQASNAGQVQVAGGGQLERNEAVLGQAAAGGTAPVVAAAVEAKQAPDEDEADYGLEFVAQVGGSATAVWAEGNRAVVCEGSHLQVLDISDISNPIDRGRVRLPADAKDLVVSGDLAFVASSRQGLLIVDISDPDRPWIRGRCKTPGVARNVRLAGSIAYVSGSEGCGLQVVDVADPSRPQIVGACTDMTAQSMDVSGNIVYLANLWSLGVVDVRNPTKPTTLSSLDVQEGFPGGFGVSLVAVEGYVYFSGSRSTVVIDVRDPSAPKMIGQLDLDTKQRYHLLQDFASSGSLLFARVGSVVENVQLQIIDTSQPSSPKVVGQSRIPGWLYDTHLFGNRMIVADSRGQTHFMDVSDPFHPQLIVTRKRFGGGELAVMDGVLCAGELNCGFWVFDVRNPAAPRIVQRFGDGNLREFSVSDHLLYCCFRLGANDDVRWRFDIFDYSNPSEPRLLGGCDTLYACNDILVTGNLAYVSGGEWTGVIDIADPTNPRILAEYPDLGFSVAVMKPNGIAYGFPDRTEDRKDHLNIVNLNQPTGPKLVGQVQLPGECGQIALAGNLAFVTYGWHGANPPSKNQGLQILDITDPARPQAFAPYPTKVNQAAICVADGIAYLAGGEGIEVIDVSNPSAPQTCGRMTLIPTFWHLAVSGDYLYALGWDSGLWVFKRNIQSSEKNPKRTVEAR